ncbi:MAG: DUF4920 domain-containing protein [Deltaproteobacteria bacterium]|nr:DUF4920 domain-containing protein [Deltaproteobacteria bacterium]
MNRLLPFALLVTALSFGCDKSADKTPVKPHAEEKAGHHDEKGHDDHHEKTAPSSQPAKVGKIGKGEIPSDREQKDEDGIVRRGPKLADGSVLTIAECTSALDGKNVKVEGTVAQVCARKGCWFVIEDDKKEKQVRITSKGYKFFVPKDAVGKKAIISGDLSVKKMSVAEAQHMEDDAAESTGKPAKKVAKGSTELRIAAVSLELR